MKFIYLRDSKGQPSATLTFITLSWLAVTGKLLFGDASLGEYGATVSGFLAAWIGNQYLKKP